MTKQSTGLPAILLRLIEYFVGGLFIFSGLIKLNDPVGTAIKLEEYFEVFHADIASFFSVFIPFALPLAIVLCISEVILGVALLISFRKKEVVMALAGMILFFTFLTFYSAYFNKVTDCGCFGDAIPLTPWESFYKDVILTLLIGVLLFNRASLSTSINAIKGAILGGSTLICMLIAWYVLAHLPIIDFRPYKIGNDLRQLMQAQAPCQYEYIMEKNGELIAFQEYPTDKSYTFKEMKVLNEKECVAKITDYNLTSEEGDDYTQESLSGLKWLIIVQKADQEKVETFKAAIETGNGLSGSISPMVITSDSDNYPSLKEAVGIPFPYYLADGTVLKAIVRSNPGFLLLNNGKVIGKWHYNDLPSASEVNELAGQSPR